MLNRKNMIFDQQPFYARFSATYLVAYISLHNKYARITAYSILKINNLHYISTPYFASLCKKDIKFLVFNKFYY